MLKNKLLLTALFSLLYIGVLAQTNVYNAEPGKLAETLAGLHISPDTLTELKITGVLDARDFKTLSVAKSTLKYVDLSEISIAAYAGHYENSLPTSSFQNFTVLHTVFLPSPGRTPNPIVDIHLSAFANCSSLHNITFPESLKGIADKAFLNTPLSNVILPDSFVNLGIKAFGGCYNLTSIHIPATAKYIYPGPFAGCKQLKEITVDPNNEWYASHDGSLYSTYSGGLLGALIQYPAGKENDTFVFPSTVQGMLRYALDSCENLKEIAFNDTMLVAYAFLNTLKNLETVRLNYFNLYPLQIPSEKLKAIYISNKEVPNWSGIWLIGRNEIDLSKITLYVRPELIESYKKSPHFGPNFNYVAWVPSSVVQTEANNLTVFPNPAQDSFTIRGLDEILEVKVTDLNGKEVFRGSIDTKKPINFSHLPKGLYVISAIDREKHINTKLIKR